MSGDTELVKGFTYSVLGNWFFRGRQALAGVIGGGVETGWTVDGSESCICSVTGRVLIVWYQLRWLLWSIYSFQIILRSGNRKWWYNNSNYKHV